MTFREVRNLVTAGLGAYMGLPVVLSSQVSPEAEFPFFIYSSTVPYVGDGSLGVFSCVRESEERIVEVRKEQPLCTLSFTACSMNRGEYPDYIHGDDEALDLAEKAQGWFLHAGYEYIAGHGITVVDVSNVQERSFLQVDEEARRYGFDVSIRYVRTDKKETGTVERASAIEKGES